MASPRLALRRTAADDRARPASAPGSHGPRIVAVGGGTGLPVVLGGLADLLDADPAGPRGYQLTALVTVTDDGGSSGRLRRAFNIPPPGDVRNCLTALAKRDSRLADLLQHRFTGDADLSGHSVGNLLLLALTQLTGDFSTAVERLSDILAIRGRVLPSTREAVSLVAEFEDGKVIEGETAIAARRKKIRRLWLARDVRPLPEAVEALVNADAIVVGPGSLFSSVLPNLLVSGIAATMSGVKAVRIYVANLMTEPGETDGLTLADHLDVIRDHVHLDLFDYVLVNRRLVSPSLALSYARRGSAPILADAEGSAFGGAAVVHRDLAWDSQGEKIRHSPPELARAIWSLIEAGRPARPAAAPGFPTAMDVIGGEAASPMPHARLSGNTA
jgi:uncharacterized cofD-like protein